MRIFSLVPLQTLIRALQVKPIALFTCVYQEVLDLVQSFLNLWILWLSLMGLEKKDVWVLLKNIPKFLMNLILMSLVIELST